MTGLVALTGATGFVGSAIARQLSAAGWRVRALVRRMPSSALLAGHSLEIVLGDLDNRESLGHLLQGCDAIVHGAGLVRALKPLDFFKVNEGGTQQILEAAAEHAPRARFLQVSSLAAREPQLSAYAGSKHAAEQKVAALAGERPWIALRPPAVYGPGDVELLPLFQAAKLGLIAYPAAAGARVSTIHVDDLATGVATILAASDWSTRIVEIDDEHPRGHDWPEILTALGTAFGRRPTSVRLPRSAMTPIAAVVGLISQLRKQPQVLSAEKVAELYHPNWVAAGPRLSELVRWEPLFSLEKGFADTARWYRSRSLL
ncbi:NAD-dependent epimerase/dehydratase family protein [Dongia sp.]|uniref:NAD-dependent epimerase/dehydratase family protein n=1 Tax=Dongia sp. TaxID=1977262 RepID=UPI0035B0C9D2